MNTLRTIRISGVVFGLVACLIVPVIAEAQSETEINFGRDIRPILSDKCFKCHGPDEGHRQGGLRLDLRQSALGAGESGEIAVKPGDLAASALVQRITAIDENLRMPPAETNKPLTPDEIERLKKWIESGASWEEHWSLQPLTVPPLPEVSRADWCETEIDRFILARLDREKLVPSPSADKVTLIRRVTFDLTGLPPTPEEVAAFLADESPQAYENLVDRLLASERYGEHQARFWLDAARYGDTHGLHLDNYREIWAYRDWVIRAFNGNMPYDRFVIEQVAGDLLPNPTQDQLIATGFNRCNVSTSEGGSIAEEVDMRNVVDRVVVFGTVFLGLTLDCSRCHDHKFDPFKMTDFYSLYAYFNSIDGSPLDGNKKDHEPILKVPSPEQQNQLAAYDAQLAELRGRMNAEWPEVDAAQIAWEQKIIGDVAATDLAWTTIIPQSFLSTGGATLTLLEDQSLLASGTNPDYDTYEIVGRIEGGGWIGARLEGLIHESLTNGGAGRSVNSNVVLTEFEIYTSPVPGERAEPTWSRLEIAAAWADHEQGDGNFKIQNAIDGKKETGWAIEGHAKKENRHAHFQTKVPFGGDEPQLVKFVLKQESQYGRHQFGRVRMSVTKQNPIPSTLPKEILDLAKVPAEQRNDEQRKKLRDHYRAQVTDNADFIKVRESLASVEKQRQELDGQIPTTMIWKDKATPNQAFVLKRGEYDKKGDPVERRTPAALPPMTADAPNNRLGLAQWLVSPEHPLTARVTVNRFWQQFFGTGIVKTAEDFGSQGEPPSHPKLLDWMASQFIADGWDVKRTLKRIVMSNTYRQSSKITPELLARDPRNRLLARGPRFRLDAEMLRDQALFVSGLLVEKIGGPGVKPPQPPGLWEAVGYTSSNTARFTADTGPDKVHRRTLYTFIKRTAPPPQMTTFDGPSREACTVRRERTNTPLQALLLFNDPQYVEAAKALALRAVREGGTSPESRAARMFQLATCRMPSSEELQLLVSGYQADLATFRQDAAAAQQLLSVGGAAAVDDPAEAAAWTMTANLLLNLDEVVNRN